MQYDDASDFRSNGVCTSVLDLYTSHMSAEPRAHLTADDIAALIKSHQALEGEVEQLKHQLAWFKKQLFGSKSERRVIDPSPQQLSLGESVSVVAGDVNVTPSKQTVKTHERRRPQPTESDDTASGLRFDDRVPVEVIELEDPATKDIPRDQLEVISEKVTYRLAQRPGDYVVLKYVRKVLKHKASGAISCAPAPAGVLERSHADVSFLARLVIDKFVYHLPLYRQHQRLQDAGIEVSRGWLTQLVHRTASLLEPIYVAQLASIRAGSVIAMDETPIKAGRKSRGKMKTTYYWPLYGDRDEIVFPWFASRAGPNVTALLGEYTGTLLSDGYAAYSRYVADRSDVVHAQCWAHTRRGFVEAEDVEPALATEALARIRELYAHEDHIAEQELTGDPKLERRVEHSKPIVEAFFAWCEERLHDQGMLPTNPFTKALNYALARRAELSVFLADPDVPIDTNHLERALRPVPLGRKNWLFCWTEIGARYVGVLQSLLVTCRLHRIHPYDYLVDVLQRIDQHSASQVHLLTPRLWKENFAADPLRAPLESIERRSKNAAP
jgi:transposase